MHRSAQLSADAGISKEAEGDHGKFLLHDGYFRCASDRTLPDIPQTNAVSVRASDATYPYADAYITIYLLGSLFVMVGLGMNSFINSQGFRRIGMMTVSTGAAANILLDPIFYLYASHGNPRRGARHHPVAASLCHLDSAVLTSDKNNP